MNVQPHSGSSANLAAYFALLQPGDSILSMSLSNGAHLTHGSPVNFSGKLYDMHFYDVDENGFIDYDAMARMARTLRPKLILAGASAYSRIIDYRRFADAARETGALFMVDMAHVAGLVADLGGPVTSNEQGVSVYISAIPFNFYAILMVLITLLSALEIFPDFGPMRKAEQRARTTGKLLRDGAVPMMGTELEELQKGNDSDVKPNVMLDFLVPIMILVGTAIWTYIAKGGVKILECFIITVIYMSIELSIRKVFKSVTDLVSTAVQGMKSVMSATLILALAYCINTITKSMGAADFLLGVCESWMTPALFLSVTFIAGAVISFFTGSSWGTFAICIPIAVPMAYSFTGGQLGTLVYAAVGAVVSGGLFGDHCSPVSDTSVLSSLGAACDHIDHVRTQLPYALLAAAVSIILWVVVALVGGAA